MKKLISLFVLLICIVFSFSAKSQNVEGTVAGHEFRLDKVEKELRKLRGDYSKLIETGASEAQKRELEQMMDRKITEFKLALQEMVQKESTEQVSGSNEQASGDQKKIESPNKENTSTNEDIVRLLAQGLSDSTSENRLQTIEALGKIGQPALRYIGWAALSDSYWVNRQRALEILINIGVSALEYIGTVALRDSHSDIREIAIKALGRFGKSSLSYLYHAAVSDSHSGNRSLALRAIEEIIQKNGSDEGASDSQWKFKFGPAVYFAGLSDLHNTISTFSTVGAGMRAKKGQSKWVFDLSGSAGGSFLGNSREAVYRDGDHNVRDTVAYGDGNFVLMVDGRAIRDIAMSRLDDTGLVGGLSLSLVGTNHETYIDYNNPKNDKTANALYAVGGLVFGSRLYDFSLTASLEGGIRQMRDATDFAYMLIFNTGYLAF